MAGAAWLSAENSQDIYLIKCDSLGNLVWQKTYGGPAHEESRSVVALPSGEYVVMGNSNIQTNGLENVILIKIDSVGNILWEKTFGGTNTDMGHSMVLTPDGGFAIVGYTTSFGAQGADIYLLKVDASGNLVWEKRFGGGASDAGESVICSPENDFLIAGSTNSTGAGSLDIYLSKIDASGKQLWEKTFGGSGSDEGKSVAPTADGGYLLVGTTIRSFKTQSEALFDVYVVKSDSAGNLVWQKTFGGADEDRGFSACPAHDGGYAIVGSSGANFEKGSDGFLVRIDSRGNLIWEKTFGGMGADGIYLILPTYDRGYVLGGATYSSGSGCSDVYLIKTDVNGNVSEP